MADFVFPLPLWERIKVRGINFTLTLPSPSTERGNKNGVRF
jgi:hypothetical protein